jgi:hypothetical protein
VKIPFRWILIVLAASWIAPPLLCQEQLSSADAFRIASQAGVPTDWTHSSLCGGHCGYRNRVADGDAETYRLAPSTS